jgi:ABC-type transport system involved in multi-copper enzyme maturation permease subunit
MSVLERASALDVAAVPPLPAPSWGLWRRQLAAAVRLELKKGFRGRRVLGVVLLAAMPVALIAQHAHFNPPAAPANVGEVGWLFAGLYQAFILRLVLFFGCVLVFGNLIRRELLDRSLHFYFLSPVRRELLAAAKYLTGLVVTLSVFGAATVASFFLAYAGYDGAAARRFIFDGPGLGHLGAYLGVTALACLGYGAVFLAAGFFTKSPALPAVTVFGWENLHFLLPPALKKLSVIHYLQGLCPVPISQGPLAILADAPSPWVAVPGLLGLTLVLLFLSAWKIRRMEILYTED